MRTTRSIRTALAAATTLLLLTACGGGAATDSPEDATEDGAVTGAAETGDAAAAGAAETGDAAATAGAATGAADDVAVATEGPELVLTISTSKPAGDPNVVALEEAVATELDERTGGRITLEVFPGDELGTSLDQIERASTGEIEMVLFNPAITSSLSSRVGVFSAPYVFEDYEQVTAAIESPAGEEAFAELTEVHRLRPLGTWFLGSWVILTRDAAVNSCEDLQGVQLRTPAAPVMQEFFERCGAEVVSMTFSEVYLALQTGVIGALPTPLALIGPASLDEVVSFGTGEPFLTEIIQPLINEDFWQGLSPEDQEIIAAAFESGREVSDTMTFELEEEAVSLMLEAGIEVVEDVDHEAFIPAAEATWDTFVEDWGGQEAFDALREAAGL